MFDASAMADRLVEASGLDAIDLRLRVRYLKAKKLLPSAPRGTRRQIILPQVESLHAVTLLLAAMAGGPQLRTPEVVRTLWTLPLANIETAPDGTSKMKDGLPLGLRLLAFMEIATDPVRRPDFLAQFKQLNVAQHISYAAITYHDRTEHFMPPGAPLHSRYRAPMSVVALAAPEVFLELAEVVMRSRAEAARLNVVIPVREAWRALGYKPAPKTPLAPFSVSDYAPASANAETGRAGSPAREPATCG